ncbi:MAG TPA: hypothetical protein VFC45_06340 [Pseudolabrys sp.]|nr:hypothetical protein [Pseudolabrys sp.]
MVLAAIAAMALTACNPQDNPSTLAGQPRGASVAFESIDGPPPGQFRRLVQSLNTEAQSRQLAVMSHDSASAYRVRGYLAAKVAKRETTISWVWDVFDRDDHRALRITGEETAKGVRRNAWSAADDEMLNRIARSSMDQLAAFLTSPEVAPGTPDTEPQQVAFGLPNSTPEAAGIYRISQPNADPAPGETVAPATVPLPPKRPPLAAAAVSARETLMLAASSY